MSNVDFAHLHVHTEYSLLDGLSRVKKLVQSAKDQGMKHLAITDHGTMYGVLEFYKACKAQGINSVIGVEAYLTENLLDRTKSRKEDYTHLLLFAKNQVGYSNLLKLTTIANTRGVRANKPRMDKEVLSQYSEGIIATSSCLGGEIPQLILKDQYEEACKVARWYQNVLGPENYYLEIQEHHGHDERGPSPQPQVNQALYRMNKEMGIPLIATNDLHYIDADDAPIHETLLCIQTASQLAGKHFHFDSSEYFLRSGMQMAALFPELPDALTNTIRLAEQCHVDPYALKAQLPTFYPIPPEYQTADAYLYQLCLRGIEDIFGGITENIQQRLDYEFKIIAQKGFIDYFLIVWDFINFSRKNGIRCSARGSAAGSLLAYSLGITNVDPLRYQLPFERFFTPEREDMPDIDMDFQDNRREEVLNYVGEKYGWDCVAQLVTFNTMAAKNSVKDVARVLEFTEVGDRISRLIPTGPNVTLQGSIDEITELQELITHNEQAQEIINQALKLEGSVRSTGVHAAGVVIGNAPLEDFVPLRYKDYKDPTMGRVTQYEQSHLEELGLIKFDFLGLVNLRILDETVTFVRAGRGEEIVLEKIPLDEVPEEPEKQEKRRKAFALLTAGETTGIFQLEGAKMREYIQQLAPTRIEDIMAMVALYRPGPMESIPEFIDAKHGRKKVRYLDPRLSEWLDESYGVIVYQDQVLFIAVNIAGFSWGKAHKFRKALSKKKMDEVASYRADFIKGCVSNKIKPGDAEQLFTLIEPFGGYGFNKPHAASYAVVAYYCAYLKANYTAEFMAATLTAVSDDATKLANAIAECKRMQVGVYGPDVNRSDSGFTIEKDGVRFGLLAIKGVGEGPINEIVHVRKKDGPFRSLADFCTRVRSEAVTKKAIETLIKTGALDSLEGEGKRHVLIASLDRAMQFGKNERIAKNSGLLSLFGDLEEESRNSLGFTLSTNAEEIARKTLLAWEKELIGIYISNHPLSYIGDLIKEKTTHTTVDLANVSDKQKVTICGIVKEIRRVTTKKNEIMCIVQLEDMFGTVSVTVFPRVFEETSEYWVEDRVVIIRGDIQIYNEKMGLLCNSVSLLDAAEEEMNRKRYMVWIKIPLSGNDEIAISDDIMKVQKLKNCLSAKPGRDQYELLVQGKEWSVRLTPQENTLTYSQELHAQLEKELGPNMIEIKAMN